MPIPLFFVAGATVSKIAVWATGAALAAGAGTLAVEAYQASQDDSDSDHEDAEQARQNANHNALINQAVESLRCVHKSFGLELNTGDAQLKALIIRFLNESDKWPDELTIASEDLPENQQLMAQHDALTAEIKALERKRDLLSRL